MGAVWSQIPGQQPPVANNPGPPTPSLYTLLITAKTMDTSIGDILVPIIFNMKWSKMLIWVGVLADIGSLITLTCATPI